MPESVGLAWYSTGTVKLTQGSTDVIGVGTNWKNAGLKVGDVFTIDRVTLYMIASVNSNTSITLLQAYAGTSGNTMNYYVIRNFAATLQAELSAQVSQLVGEYESWRDGRVNEIAIPFDFSSLYKGVWATGRSYKALDIVMYNSALYVCLLAHTSASGNTPGTAGANNYWGSYAPAMPASIDVLNYNNAWAHNSLYRGKNLGTAITAEHYAAIDAGTFTDLYPGDFFQLPIDGTTTAYVIGCNINKMLVGNNKKHILLWLVNNKWQFTINDTDSCEGHFLNSKMYTEHFPYILEKILEVIPEENLLSWHEQVGDSIDSNGKVNHYTGTNVYIGLPSFANLIGYNVSENHSYKVMGRSVDWPAFRFNPSLQIKMVYNWLGESANATQWNTLGWEHNVPQPFGTSRVQITTKVTHAFPYIHIGTN